MDSYSYSLIRQVFIFVFEYFRPVFIQGLAVTYVSEPFLQPDLTRPQTDSCDLSWFTLRSRSFHVWISLSLRPIATGSQRLPWEQASFLKLSFLLICNLLHTLCCWAFNFVFSVWHILAKHFIELGQCAKPSKTLQ